MKSPTALVVAALLCVALVPRPAHAQQRVHYIAADEVSWNYAPQHQDLVTGRPLPPLLPTQFGWTYRKAIYREYTDRFFDQVAGVAPLEQYRGLVGPTVHAEVGDTVIVIFKNRTRIPVDIAVAGLRSSPKPGPVMPGNTRTFRWAIGQNDGPASQDASSVLYVYASDIRQNADENAGLIGPLIVTRRGGTHADGSPIDVDQEIVTLFSAQRESLSPLFDVNLHDLSVNPRRIRIIGKPNLFIDDNTFVSINGYVYGNMPMPVLRVGKRVRWYLISTQNPFDFHAPMWDGQTVLSQGNRVDSIGLAWRRAVVDMIPDDPGVWLLRCTVNVHLASGMAARYRVLP